jgi:ribosomal protein S18 acetylase RimI-like enzyme
VPDAESWLDLARRLEQSISLAPMPTGTGLESLNCGAFRAWFTAYTDNPQANYAMPVAPTEPAAFGAEVEALRTLFGSRVRKLRVEFVEELWPGLAPALQRSGLHLQAREPLMACTRSEFTPVVAPGVSVRLLAADSSDSELAAYLHIADERPADGSRPVPDKAVARLRQMLSSGNETCAIGTIDARDAVVGRWIAQDDGLGEITSIVTLPEFRRRGAAATLVSELLRGLFDSGRNIGWLNAANEQARSVYAKLGFRSIGSLLNYED